MALYLGLDSSTQGVKALVIDVEKGSVVAAAAVDYGRDLPHYGCPQGALPNGDPQIFHAPPGMWVEGLDLVLQRLQATGAPLGQVAAVSGSGQQHGSVYLRAGFEQTLKDLDPAVSLAEATRNIFARATSPIWMDSSTRAECDEIEQVIGARLTLDTGSPAVERFAGPQIRKFWKQDPEGYTATARIHLVSSFLCSLLIGGDAPIDPGDGAGMNLLNLHRQAWDEAICQATAPELGSRLPRVVPSSQPAGGLHSYFARYGFTPGIPVIAWSGDNPNSLIGVGAGTPGTAVISLGTSDVFFAAMDRMHTDPAGYGHVFGNPAGGFMSLICFKNGSLARELVRDLCGMDWPTFDGLWSDTPTGRDGNLMLPYFVPEITPRVLKPTVRRAGSPDFVADHAEPALLARAVVESQVLAMRRHSAWIGDFDTVRVTGGASRSPGIVRVIADVFQARVEKISVADSAALGAALRAAQGQGGYAWDDLYARFCQAEETVEPNRDRAETVHQRLHEYAALSEGLNS